VGGNDAHAFLEGGRPTAHYERDGEHGPREVFHGDLDDDECHAFTTVIDCIGVGESEDEGGGEDRAAEEEACCCL
jgi:hypothetical protein